MPKDIIINKSKRWEEDQRVFRSSVTHHPTRGSQLYAPLPIMERWGFPDSVIFQLTGDTVVMRKGRKE